MKPLIVFVAFSVILSALLLAFPHMLLSPGELMQGHQELKGSCLKCHTPFRGVKSVSCTGCHRQDSIGIKTTDGKPLAGNARKVDFHRGLAAGSCIECHTDHKGRNAKKVIRAFRHEAVSASLRNNCNACHSGQKPKDPLHRNLEGSCVRCHDTSTWKSVLFDHGMLEAKQSGACKNCHIDDKPSDDLHRQLSSNCAECHTTGQWKPATFDHGKFVPAGKQCLECHSSDLPSGELHRATRAGCGSCHGTNRWKPATFDHGKFVPAGKQCLECHSADLPSDELHRASRAGCGSCHGTGRWKPARFEHDRYFRLDGDHRASCATCHTDLSNFRKYTCYNCHEHSPSKIDSEHREEGISNFQNCVRCHRSGSEGGKHGRESHGRYDDD
jgi:hypothetical protein